MYKIKSTYSKEHEKNIFFPNGYVWRAVNLENNGDTYKDIEFQHLHQALEEVVDVVKFLIETDYEGINLLDLTHDLVTKGEHQHNGETIEIIKQY